MNLYSIFMWFLRFIIPGLPENNGTTDPTSAIPGIPICIYAEKVCPNRDVTFYLYTTEHPEPRLLDLNYPDNITSSLFMTGSPFKLLLHGYGANYTQTPNAVIGPVYLSSGSYNVIAASYGDLVLDGCYVQATINLPVIANCTAQLIDFLVKKMNVPLQDIHVIGFSLGAQGAGQAGNYVTVGKLKRITGLDPAGPLFLQYGNDAHVLSKDDAEFVEVVHTNGGLAGQLVVLGHVDFFMNGGSLQPDCQLTDFACSHVRAPMYFAESITTQTGFWGYRCSQMIFAIAFPFLCDSGYNAIMGEYANSSARGIYRVDTNGKSPFAIGKHRISPLTGRH
ncbi:pancreatic triacylglycerol lipase-like [Periplaneta americana]|uniref:pancreatic triacylglycerol lipase-like n=1 Tax=Periplaneta americana TaxID=6978 RepID=UPI0037E908E8